ncbi:peptidase [Mycobacterium phage DrLupo]|uniref:Hydrolase n=1 Tax=Mycobacterium phage DrLupo TaxID=2499037 RepID=A0A3S9UQR9_9CAUD|nr:peptidase [Mycobacterium phage DrLupo]AZS12633.1 hydrolase [Mycobacterium phage DrLupo]
MTVDLGRRKLHDPRSRNFAYPVTRSTVDIGSRSITHRMDSDHLDQFYLGACVGFSGAQLLNCRIAKKSRMVANTKSKRTAFDYGYMNNDDGIEFYSNSTLLDPFDWVYPPTDEGSSALGLMKSWQELGIIRSYRWAFTFDQFLSALGKQPVLVGTNWYSGMSEPIRRNGRWLAVPGGTPQGGHEYLATGILGPSKLIRCEQSWGEGFYAKTFYITFDNMRWLLDQGGDVAVPELI